MTTLSQENLIKLAQENEENGQLDLAIENLKIALSLGYSNRIINYLCLLYLKNKQEDQAYTLIKEVPDLFSEQKTFDMYLKILQKCHYYIEALQLDNLLGRNYSKQVIPASEQEQEQIMKDFRKVEVVSQNDYQSLLKLNFINYQNFAQSLLLDPTQNFALRLSMCEELVKLGLKEEFKVWVLGELETFIPAQTPLLEKSTIYKEVITSIGDRFRNSPSMLPVMLGEGNLVLGTLYPKLEKYIQNTDAFAHDLISFIQNKNGDANQKLLKKIYDYLPK